MRVRGRMALGALGVLATAALAFLAWGNAPAANAAVTGPGLQVRITQAAISEAGQPLVTVRITDSAGNPVQLAELDAGSLRFGLSRLSADGSTGRTQYANYIAPLVKGLPFVFGGQTLQPALASAMLPNFDSGGTYTQLPNGEVTYLFKSLLPAGYDRTTTHSVGVQATRNARQYAANDVYNFVPDGSPVSLTRQLVTTEGCSQCHSLAAHGGQRTDTRLCVLCHTPQGVDPESGNAIDFKVMIHKIHRGKSLPSVDDGKPYMIVGFRQQVFDFSHVEFPKDIKKCGICHQGPQATSYLSAPSAAACGACHDGVDFRTGKEHKGGAQPDTACRGCHTPSGIAARHQ